MAKLRVLVVEDSVTVRRRLCEVIAADPELEVAGEAEDGRQAIEMCRTLRPDVVTLDMMLPVLSGLAATEYIMAHFATPILVVSSSTNRGELFKTYDALAAGAVDVLEKPTGREGEGEWEARLRSAVRIVARIKVITHPRARLAHLGRHPGPRGAPRPRTTRYRVVALGASTGGPGAVVEILRGLPPGFPLPILIVLHIGAPFAGALAEWLDAQTVHRVRYAVDGEALDQARGGILIAPPDRHLVVEGSRLGLTEAPERHSCRPSVDVLFESVARSCGEAAVACLLTGMGRDGAAGLLEVRRAGGLTLAQDESTSVVYGMPREGVALGAVERVLPIGEIGPALAAVSATSGEAKP